MLRFLVLALMLAYVYALSDTPYKTCVTPNPVNRFEFGQCTKSPCTAFKGFSIRVFIGFKAPLSTDSLFVYTTWKFGDVKYETIKTDGCPVLSESNCPIVKGQDYTVSFVFPIPDELPLDTGILTIIIRSKELKVITCADIAVEVV